MKNYIKVTSSNGAGLDTHGTFFFDDHDRDETAIAVSDAKACVAGVNRTRRRDVQGNIERPARASVWVRADGVPFGAIGETALRGDK